MLERLELEKTEDKPWVILDREQNVFEIGGRSLPENSDEFYAPVKEWLLKYSSAPNDTTPFVCRFDYFNSSSARRIIEIFLLLKKIQESEKEVKISWFCEKDDLMLKKRGNEMLSALDIPYEILEF